MNAIIDVNVIHKLHLWLPRPSLLFIRPDLDYGDVVWGQPNLTYLTNKIKSVRYNEDLALTFAIGETSKEILYLKLGFESLKDTGSLRRLSESVFRFIGNEILIKRNT